ncbi:hypothetical protein P7C70_g7499, partial [Phenoliferia sp. Uapishka_3]
MSAPTALRNTARLVASSSRLPVRRAPLRLFSTSKRTLADAPPPPPDDKAKDGKDQKKKPDEPQDTTVPGRSPFQAFVDVLKDEVRKNREWQDSVKQLQGEASKVQDSEAMRKAKEVYEKARLTASIKENPRLRAAAEELRKAGSSVNDAVNHAVQSMEENPLIRGSREALYKAGAAVGSAALTASEPLRKTEAYKAVASEITEAIDDAANNVQHGGYVEREDRRRRREARLAKAGKSVAGLAARKLKVAEDPLAGGAVQLHATANEVKTSRFASITPEPVKELLSSLGAAYQESENPFVSTARSVTSTIGRFFDETETAKVTRLIKEMDPAFNAESFLKDLREYIVPELVDAYVNTDQATLKVWTSEGTYNVLMATLQPFMSPTLLSESRVLDIRNLDIMKAKILENELPVFVVAWRTQEILAYRDVKTGEITVGSEDKIEQVGYVAVMTRIEEEVESPVTGGWKVIDIARRSG